MEDGRVDLIKNYFSLGLKHSEIVSVLFARHNISLSVRHLIRILHKNGLYRRKSINVDGILEAACFIDAQQNTSGFLHGYRWMHEKCKRKGLSINKEDVRCLLTALNPEMVALRQRHRLRRRQYTSKGPNFIWHMDSYDKLRPFGICINGCIDGFSRKIIWLNAYHTSSDPSLIGSYYMESVTELSGCPTIVRADMGTENGVVCEIQRFLRQEDTDTFQGLKSFMYGKSCCNQRIECWWGMFRKECAEYWITLFKELVNNGDFDGTFLDKSLILFCFLHIIQNDMDSTVDIWNNHSIRRSRTGTTPHGRPNVLYCVPELSHGQECLHPKSEDEIAVCNELVEHRKSIPCDKDIYDWCISVMKENNISLTLDPTDAVDLYLTLRESIRQII